MRVIDMECNVPKRAAGGEALPAAAAPAAPGVSVTERPAGYGMANYERIFRSRREGADPRPDTELSKYVDLLDRVGIVRAVPFGAPNDEVAELLREYPDRFLGLARSACRRSSTASRPAIGATTRSTPRRSSSTSRCASTRR
jgi:hypothetical protein